jgi:hypothetical protein
MLQEQVDGFMEKKITDVDNYVDWLKWASDVEKRRQAIFEPTNYVEDPVLLQVHGVENGGSHNNYSVQLTLSNNDEASTRWKEICQKIQVTPNLDEEKRQQLWKVLEYYQDVFAWNKGELGCCTIGEHSINTQGFPPCKVSPGRLSYLEEAKVKRQINVLVDLGKMKPNNSEYACHVTLPIKKEGSRRFCGDYRPLNMQTRWDSFPMPLVDDVITQLGKSSWFIALDL